MNPLKLWTGPIILKALHAKGFQDFEATGVSIDSRTLQPGDLFIALKGPSLNGHDYVAMAFEKGAIAAVISELPQGLNNNLASKLIWVEDGEKALADLGKAARARSSAKIVGITGSVGKTGTKEALHHLLSGQGLTTSSALSYNNQWGVPLSLSRLPEEAVYGIFEMGMNHPGEIISLTQMVRPHVAVITTVVGAHQAFFSSLEEIALAKAEIFQGLLPGGVAILNRDNTYFDLLKGKAQEAGVKKILSFGFYLEADSRGVSYNLLEEGSDVQAVVCGEHLTYRVSHPGLHWVSNSLALLATVAALGVPLSRVVDRLATLPPLKGRGLQHHLTLQGKKITLIDESYNANPSSMEAALNVLGKIRPQERGRRIAVLGDMRELGASGPAAHLALKPLLEQNHVDLVVTCGPLMAQLYETLPQHQRSACVDGTTDLLPHLRCILQEGDVLMLKGSNGIGLGPIVQQLVQEDGVYNKFGLNS